MKKIIIATLVVLIIVAGYFIFQPKYTGKITTPGIVDTQPKIAVNNVDNIPGWKTFTNEKYHLSVQYPTDFKISEQNNGAYFNESINYTLSISAPSDYQKNTNFTGAWISINNDSSIEKCFFYNSNDNNPDMTATRVINGITFHYNPDQPFPDSAMGGQRGLYSLFAAVFDNQCYRVDETIGWHDSNWNEPAGYHSPVPDFDLQKVNSDFDRMISSVVLK
jgi:hypothetical protein